MNCKEQSQISCTVLNELVDDLREADQTSYNNIIRSVELLPHSLREIGSWSEECYTRNCIYEDNNFELILLCWEAGQATPIHDHGGEECWVKIVEGSFEEIIYQENDQGELEEVLSNVSKEGDVSYMVDFMGSHSLKNLSNSKSMSLHLYAKPIKTCRVFDEETQEMIDKDLSYDTILF